VPGSKLDIETELAEALFAVFAVYGQQITDQIKASLASADKLASGSLYKSIQFQVEYNGQQVSMSILGNEYLKWVDSGRAADSRQPPMQAILKWIQSRNIKPNQTARKNTLGRFSRGFRFEQQRNKLGQFKRGGILEQQTKLAWAIAKSIQKNGFPGLHILDTIDGSLAEAMAEAISAVTGQVVSNAVAASLLSIQTPMFKTTLR
jgi:hypothetical protein